MFSNLIDQEENINSFDVLSNNIKSKNDDHSFVRESE